MVLLSKKIYIEKYIQESGCGRRRLLQPDSRKPDKRISMTDVFNKTKTYTYDGAGRLKTETYVVADGATIETTYEYDERGNRLSKEQLAQQDDPYGISVMEYDPRPSYGYGEGETVYTYDANNRMITSKYNYDNYMNEDHTYTYDNNGNLKSDYSIVFYDDFAPADGTHIVYHEGTENYTYDNLNRLKRYSGEIYADYAYDPTGMRISKKLENENQINYVWSGGNIIGEYGIDGSKTYLRGAGGEIVKTKDGNSEERYFAYNGHGDTTSIIEKDPESVSFGVTATYEYDAFGNLIEGSETGETHENSFRYNGQQVDEESGLIYLRNRYYNPEIGRFITEDPYWNVNNMIYGEDGGEEDEVKMPDSFAIIQSVNLYIYCMSNPVNLADLLGTVAGDLFLTPDEAAIDWAWNYYGITEYSNMEHASLLYIVKGADGNYYYSYTVANDFSPLNSDPYSLQNHVWAAGGTTVGFIHSHPFTNYPSDVDKDLAEANGHYVYVVGKSYYSDGVDICKQFNYGDGSKTYPVAADMSYRRLTYGEQREANNRFLWKWDNYQYEIELGYKYRWQERGYI